MRGAKSNSQLREIIKSLELENSELRGLIRQYMLIVKVIRSKVPPARRHR